MVYTMYESAHLLELIIRLVLLAYADIPRTYKYTFRVGCRLLNINQGSIESPRAPKPVGLQVAPVFGPGQESSSETAWAQVGGFEGRLQDDFR